MLLKDEGKAGKNWPLFLMIKDLRSLQTTIDRFRFDLWNYKSFPRSHWRRILLTTNGLERNQQGAETKKSRIRGVLKMISRFLRVAVCIMMDINEDWITGKRYLSLEE